MLLLMCCIHPLVMGLLLPLQGHSKPGAQDAIPNAAFDARMIIICHASGGRVLGNETPVHARFKPLYIPFSSHTRALAHLYACHAIGAIVHKEHALKEVGQDDRGPAVSANNGRGRLTLQNRSTCVVVVRHGSGQWSGSSGMWRERFDAAMGLVAPGASTRLVSLQMKGQLDDARIPRGYPDIAAAADAREPPTNHLVLLLPPAAHTHQEAC